MTTIDNIMALVDALEDQVYLCAQGEKSNCDTAREALRTALTDAIAVQVLPDFSTIFGGDK